MWVDGNTRHDGIPGKGTVQKLKEQFEARQNGVRGNGRVQQVKERLEAKINARKFRDWLPETLAHHKADKSSTKDTSNKKQPEQQHQQEEVTGEIQKGIQRVEQQKGIQRVEQQKGIQRVEQQKGIEKVEQQTKKRNRQLKQSRQHQQLLQGQELNQEQYKPQELQQDANPDDDYYSLNHRGTILIFDQSHSRNGNEEDVSFLKKTFETNLGCDYIRFPDLTRKQIRKKLMELNNTHNFKANSYLIVFVLAHGGVDSAGREFVLDSNGKKAYLSKTFFPFIKDDLKDFRDQPKVLIVNACRGRDLPEHVQTDCVPLPTQKSQGTRNINLTVLNSH